MIFSVDTVKMCKEKTSISWMLKTVTGEFVESLLKNEENKDTEGLQFLLSCLD